MKKSSKVKFNSIQKLIVEDLEGLINEIRKQDLTLIIDKNGNDYKCIGVERDNEEVLVFLDPRYEIVEAKRKGN